MKIIAICAGKLKPLMIEAHPNYPYVLSGIDKKPISTCEQPEEVEVNLLGITQDEQADLEVHGGLEKAIYAYPIEHYPFWQESLLKATGKPKDWTHGQLGENLTVQGFFEKDVFIGDRWLIGGVELVVTKLREPCFKLNAKMGFAEASKLMLQTARSGWYLRVLQPGTIQAGERIQVIPGKREISIHDQTQARIRKDR